MKKINLENANIKLVIDDVNYYHNNNNYTTCVVRYYVKMPETLWNLIGDIEGEAKSTTHCSPNDEYDQKTGEKVALARAENKAYEKVFKEIRKKLWVYINSLEAVIPVVENFKVKTTKSIDHNKTYIKNIS